MGMANRMDEMAEMCDMKNEEMGKMTSEMDEMSMGEVATTGGSCEDEVSVTDTAGVTESDTDVSERIVDSLEGTLSDDWDELAETCLLAEDEEEVEELLGELSDEELEELELLEESDDEYEIIENTKDNAQSESETTADPIIDGYIYLITNLINGKQYVGQTTYTIGHRWYQHVRTASSTLTRKQIIDRAIAKYGEENFIVEEIEYVCHQPLSFLDYREGYWIRQYKTCIQDYGKSCGYNVSRGGHSQIALLSSDDESEIIRIYRDTLTPVQDIAKTFHVSSATINVVLDKHDVPHRTDAQHKKMIQHLRGIIIVRQDNNIIDAETFYSVRDAAHWVQITYNVLLGINAIARQLIRAACTGHDAYGHYWDIPAWTAEEKAQYLTDEQMRIQSRNHMRNHSKGNRCLICHKIISNNATWCIHHVPGNRKNKGKNYRRLLNGEVPLLGDKPLSEEELQGLLRFHTIEDIGRMYGVSGNAVKKFAKVQYGLSISRSNLFKIWNETVQMHEYVEQFPMSVNEFLAWIDNGNTIAQLANQYHISESTLHGYFHKVFTDSEIALIQQHTRHLKSVYDKTDNYQADSYAQMARYLINVTGSSDNYRNLSRTLWRHLELSQEEYYLYHGHQIALVRF